MAGPHNPPPGFRVFPENKPEEHADVLAYGRNRLTGEWGMFQAHYTEDQGFVDRRTLEDEHPDRLEIEYWRDMMGR